MSKVRLLTAGIVSLLITAGYLASQSAYLGGRASEYATQVDSPPIVALSLVIFLAAIVFYFLKPRDEEPE